MTTKPEVIAQIEAALTAGPTDGPWIAAGPSFGAALPKYLNEVVVDREGDDDDTYLVCRCPLGLDADTESGITLDYIAACNPAAMSEVLAHIEAQEAEIERLREALNELLQTITNPECGGKVDRDLAIKDARTALTPKKKS